MVTIFLYAIAPFPTSGTNRLRLSQNFSFRINSVINRNFATAKREAAFHVWEKHTGTVSAHFKKKDGPKAALIRFWHYFSLFVRWFHNYFTIVS
jgi:hypothetical protein